MFPPGLPGFGLVLLRIAVATRLIACVVAAGDALGVWVSITLLILALAVCIGILTPIISLLVIVTDLAMAANLGVGTTYESFISILVAVALSALGPGAYSLDAYRFGRRMVVLESHGDSDS